MDDDNYVNPRALLQLLKTFPRDRDVYVGKPSLNRPIHASERQSKNPHGVSLPPFPIGCCSQGWAYPRGGTCPGGGTWLLSKAWIILFPAWQEDLLFGRLGFSDSAHDPAPRHPVSPRFCTGS